MDTETMRPMPRGPELQHTGAAGKRRASAWTSALLLVQASRRATGDVSPCVEDNFGMAGTNWSRPFEKGVEQLRCDLRYTDASRLPKFVLNYYPSIEDFMIFNGTDMVPELHAEYFKPQLQAMPKWVPGKNGPTFQSRRISVGDCEVPQDDGGSYIVQRVGPLVSTGNYDYWQFGWQDVWRLSRHLAKHKEGIMFTSSFSGPVDSSGKVLGHPPIHIHHIHITPTPGVITKMSARDCLTGADPNQCFVANLAVEQHGDYQCTEEDGGIDCFFERTADGHAKILTTPVDLEGEINDVRAPDSEPMTWWYQVILRWHPISSSLRPLSQLFIVGPGISKFMDQRTNVLVFPVNTRERSVYWYSGRMLMDGTMARNKLHSHNTLYHSSYFFRANPEDLGLDEPRFWPEVPSEPLLLKDVNFKDFDEAQAFFLGNLAKAAKAWDEWCPPSNKECRDSRPALTCQSWVANEDFVDPASGKSFAYDRRAPCCCREQNFASNDIFTVIAFMNPLKTPPGPHAPNTMPKTANMHIHWLMTFSTPDNESHYNNIIMTQNPDKNLNFKEAVKDLSRYPVWDILDGQFYGVGDCTTNNQALSTWQRVYVTAMWVSVVGMGHKLELLGFAIFLGLAGIMVVLHLVVHSRTVKRARDHPIVMCVEQSPCPAEAGHTAVDCVRAMEAVMHDE